MSRSEFRYNKKRKHYAYLFKDVGSFRKNILITTKPIVKGHKIKANIPLFRHPNPNSKQKVYIVNRIYVDDLVCFDVKVLKWKFHPNDKRIIKRLKKKKKVGIELI